MQIYSLLRSVCFTFLFTGACNSQSVSLKQPLLEDKGDFCVQFASNHKNTSYDGKQFVFNANPSGVYIFLTVDFAFLGLAGLAIVHDSFKQQTLGAQRGEFCFGLVLTAGGAFSTKLFFDAINMKISQIEYMKFDDIGIYQWGKLRVKWKDVSNIYLSRVYINDILHRKASFTDKRLNDLFVFDDSDFFLPVKFDDFLLIAEYYLNKFNPVEIQP